MNENPINQNHINQKEETIIQIVDLTMPDRLKIGIGLSTSKMINAEFVRMLFQRFAEWMQKYTVTILFDTVLPLDLSRNIVVETAKDKCDYIFFIDSDIIIQEGQLERLLSHGKDAICGVYHKILPPHDPLPRKKVSDILYAPIELYSDELIEIDGSGLGCFLVKTSIFDKIPYPWFEFKYIKRNDKWEQLSEDLYFCQKLQDIGIKIYCDPTVQCTHIGGMVNKELSDKYKEFREYSTKFRNDTAEEISEFTGLTTDKVYDLWRISTELVAKDYNKFIKNNDQMANAVGHNLVDFYKKNKNYIFDLTNWHVTTRSGFDYGLVNSIRQNFPFAKKILDYGSGCGRNAIDFAQAGYQVSITDYDGYTSEFARFSIKKKGLDIKFYDIEKPIDDKFDIILAFDVLEHVPDSEFKYTIERLKSLKKEGGRILTTVSFGKQGNVHPMHFESSPEKLQLLEQLNE